MRFAAVDQRRLMPENMDGASFNYPKECDFSPISRSILKIDGVTGIVVSPNFMSVYKEQDKSWLDITHRIEDILEDAFAKNELLVTGDRDIEEKIRAANEELQEVHSSGEEDSDIDPDLAEIEKDISEMLDMRAKPIVKADGGDLEFRGFDEETGTVWVYFKGACESCTSSGITLHQAIGQMLKHYIPEVTGIRRCNDAGEPLDDDGNATDDWSGNPPIRMEEQRRERREAKKLVGAQKFSMKKKAEL